MKRNRLYEIGLVHLTVTKHPVIIFTRWQPDGSLKDKIYYNLTGERILCLQLMINRLLQENKGQLRARYTNFIGWNYYPPEGEI